VGDQELYVRSIPALRLTACVLALLLAGVAAAAATFTVNSTVDAPGADTLGASLADGVCETQHGNGICTLRAAVMEANHVPGGGAIIELPQGTYAMTIGPVGAGSERDGSFDLAAPLQIVGEGPSASIVDGNDLDSVFVVSADAVVLMGLGVRRGGHAGGGIRNSGNLTLENVAVSEANGAGSRGIQNNGTLSLSHCIIANNVLTGGAGGGILNGATATAYIADSRIAENDADLQGAGVLNQGEMTIERSSILHNVTIDAGGGISNYGNLTMLNDTVANNQSGLGMEPQGGGGGIFAGAGSTRLFNVTIADNAAIRYHAPSGGGLQVAPSGAVFLKNSIVSGNFLGYVDEVDLSPSECFGDPLLSGDYNLIGARSTCTLTGVTDQVNSTDADPGLGDLLPNGGFALDQFAFN